MGIAATLLNSVLLVHIRTYICAVKLNMYILTLYLKRVNKGWHFKNKRIYYKIKLVF